MPVYAATIFLSAFLLFQIQPLIAKFILPWFGGSAAVWSAALLFFQLVLLAGYFYAHLLIRFLKPARQFILHAALLALSLATLPIIPSARWKPTGAGDPTFQIVLLLAATVGLPYMLLSATSPLLQAWYLRKNSSAIPYRLFALSNFGSMLALLSYPTLVEPNFALGRQATFWSIGFGGFALLCAIAAWSSRVGIDPIQTETKPPRPALSTILLWIGFAACASTLLLAVTSHLTQNVAPIPLLWVVPLSLYLLSFILCFESDRLYNRYIFLPLLAISLGLFAWADVLYETNEDPKRMVAALCAALFICCMVCHGELARRRPHPRYLTQFYLMVSVGGAIGGLFVALLAPHVFATYVELPIAIVVCPSLVMCSLWVRANWSARSAMAAGVLGFAIYLGYAQWKDRRVYVLSARNFYGVLRVRDDPAKGEAPAKRMLIHGTINHGTQLKIPDSERIPTSYFGAASGISRAINALGDRGPLRMGILGLGAGVTAALARVGDTLHYYEINPLVVEIANRDFSFLRGCPAHRELYMGDGRLVLENMPGEQLDFLAMDAFSSDAVPVHLLTKEAYAIYARHLKPNGVLAINISNRYLDLAPVVAQVTADLGWSGIAVYDDGYDQPYYYGSTWTLVSRDPSIFKHHNFDSADLEPLKPRRNFRAWTDDYSNIIQILK